jgi:hypothetical protein
MRLGASVANCAAVAAAEERSRVLPIVSRVHDPSVAARGRRLRSLCLSRSRSYSIRGTDLVGVVGQLGPRR